MTKEPFFKSLLILAAIYGKMFKLIFAPHRKYEQGPKVATIIGPTIHMILN
jgi:hypothetical protein